MTYGRGLAALALAAALAGCGQQEVVTIRTGSVPAETACAAAVNRNMGGSGTAVVNSNFSEAGSEVTLRSADGSEWRCLASNDGVVSELTMR